MRRAAAPPSATRGRNPGFRLTQRACASGGTSQPTGWGKRRGRTDVGEAAPNSGGAPLIDRSSACGYGRNLPASGSPARPAKCCPASTPGTTPTRSTKCSCANTSTATAHPDEGGQMACAGRRSGCRPRGSQDARACPADLAGQALVPRRAQGLSVKVKSPESLPLSRTAETSFPSVISLSTSARERPHPSAISRTGLTGIRAAKRTEMSITSRSR